MTPATTPTPTPTATRFALLVGLGLPLLGLGLPGCGFSTPLDLALNDAATARCNSISRCSDGATIWHSYGTLQSCIVRSTLLFSAYVQAAGTNVTALALEHCAARYPSYSCNDIIAGTLPADCLPLGLRSAGERCTFSEQCATGWCTNIRDSLCGTCASPPAAGDSCAANPCATGQECVSSTELCQTGLPAGSSCDGIDTVCGIGTGCINASSSSGVCVAETTQIGAPCNNGTTLCDGTRGLTCEGVVTATRTCQLTAKAAPGAPCGVLPDGTGATCINGGACFTATGPMISGQAGVCVAAAADGAACDLQHGPTCQLPARCVTGGDSGTTGICTLPTDEGCR